jgi:sugar phosphate isomerase/epimerase
MRGISRRDVVAGAFAGAAGLQAQPPPPPLKICIFSKHLQWLPMSDAAAVAAEAGFDGVDITVRDGGHVLPERVADDLPRAVEAVRKAGLEAPMITAGIVDANSPNAVSILRTASALGIRRYRWGGFKYDPLLPIPHQIAGFADRSRELSALNKEYDMCAMYHTHSGIGEVGASIWDLYEILRRLDSSLVGVNYDIGHATVEGGLGGWINTAKLTMPMMRGIALKDFLWAKSSTGDWEPEWKPIGEGMVRFSSFFRILRGNRFNGPVQLHFEHAGLGGAEHGKSKITISRAEFIEITRRELNRVREMMRETGLA